MVVTIQDRRVTDIPMELETMLQVEPCCFACHTKGTGPLTMCPRCNLPLYCSEDCMKHDYERHREEENCVGFERALQNLAEKEAIIRAHSTNLLEKAVERFGDDAFLGRETLNADIMDLLAGRFLDFQCTYDYLVSLSSVHNPQLMAVRRNGQEGLNQVLVMNEKVLDYYVELRRLTHRSWADNMISTLLLQLHRDDDAIAFVQHCLECHAAGPENRDGNIINSRKGEWPIPIQENCRMVDLTPRLWDFFNEAHHDDEHLVKFLLVPLAVKLRQLYVEGNRLALSILFQHSTAGQGLPEDVGKCIASFLCGEHGQSVFIEQRDHALRLMDCIDVHYPLILQGILDPSLLQPDGSGEVGEDDVFDVRLFFQRYECSPPVLNTLKTLIWERYWLAHYKVLGWGILGSACWKYVGQAHPCVTK